jgi:hypothetical protein
MSLPYGCRYGGCISCAAKLLLGEIDQRTAVALNGRQLADGYVLLCVARPLTNCIFDVGVESHDKLFRKHLVREGTTSHSLRYRALSMLNSLETKSSTRLDRGEG